MQGIMGRLSEMGSTSCEAGVHYLLEMGTTEVNSRCPNATSWKIQIHYPSKRGSSSINICTLCIHFEKTAE